MARCRPFSRRNRVMAVSCERVAVLHPLLRFLPRAGAEVGADVRLRAQHFAVIQELVRAEAVALHRAPRHLQTRRAFVARTDAVLPVVVRREVSSRPAQDRDIQLLRRRPARPAGSRWSPTAATFRRRCRHQCSGRVLDEVSVDLGIDVADYALGVDLDARCEAVCCARNTHGAASKAFETSRREIPVFRCSIAISAKRRGAKSAMQRRHVSHSCAVPAIRSRRYECQPW